MALPIRAIPVLEGEVAKRFERERRRAERERGTIDISKSREAFQRTLDRSYVMGILK
jgi:hypothetical protein